MNSLIRFAAVVPALCAFAGASSQNHPLTPQEGEVTIINPSATRSDSGLTVINIYNIFLQNAPKSQEIRSA